MPAPVAVEQVWPASPDLACADRGDFPGFPVRHTPTVVRTRHGYVFMRRYVHGHVSTLLGLAAAAALIPTSAAAAAPRLPPSASAACTPADRSFPLTTRIHGGPATYEAGGEPGVWNLELTNTTRRTCTGIHPVVVLVDERHALKPSQPRLDFYDGPRAHAVRFEATDEDELVGAFGGDGLSVGPGRTVTVKVRLAFAAGAVANDVTVNAAAVQRHGDDGDWVGQSNDYRFRIDDETAPSGDGDSTATPHSLPFADAAEELASTGPGTTAAALATLALLLITTGTILRGRSRRNR